MNNGDNGTENWQFTTAPGTHRDGWGIQQTEELTEQIVTAISELSGDSPTEIRPLHERVNVDALECIFRARTNGEPRTRGCLSFIHEGYHVRVHSDGRLHVSPVSDGRGGGPFVDHVQCDDT